MYQFLISILIIFSINQSIHCSYRYVGCYTQVFHDSYFTSSFMEPTLCFRLCDTPIIYLQKSICRCAGGGLMHYNRQNDELCTILCTKPVDRSVITKNTCGGSLTYSAYVQEHFYTQHGHLFVYQIHFSACELWNTDDVYDTNEVQLNDLTTHSSLNKLENCAAACLDQNATTKSIAFNDDNNKCICIMPLKPTSFFDRLHYITTLSNSSCDRYCNNTFEGSKTDLKYQCGSLTNKKIRAIYDLNGTCPLNFIYVKELKKCVYTYKNFWNSCTPPSVTFTYDGILPWADLLKMINKLNLNDSSVTIDFDESVVVDRSWKCLTTESISQSYTWRSSYGQSRSTLYGWGSNTRYILEGGCLRESSYSSYATRYTNRLCVTDPVNKYSLLNNENNSSTYISAINPQTKLCPSNWFDLNGRCYRMSDERKTIEQARNSCISVSSSIESVTSDKPRIWLIDANGLLIDGDELNDSPTGDIVKYVSEWQSRLGFFLLDTDPDADSGEFDTTTAAVQNLYYEDSLVSSDTNETKSSEQGPTNEFLVINSTENENSSIKDNTCVIITRAIAEENEKPIIRNSLVNNCSTSKHVLCETNTLVVQNFQYACLSKPKTLDLPTLISNQLTHELCLSVCQELQTKLAILHVNKCYCLNGASANLLNLTTDFQKYQQKSCGNACPGNSHEICGNEDIIVAFHILDSRRIFTYARTPTAPFPNYIYDSCMRLNSLNQSITYQFTINDRHDFHPRYCLALCTKYEQKYALINNGECLCTNTPMKDKQADVDILAGQYCSQQCAANYFYSCGNKDNSSIYSLYMLQPICRHGFEVAENDQQCVYSHLSSKKNSLVSAQNYCKSIGGTLAKINDIIEIQDIVPDSILHTRLMQQLLVFYKFKFVNDTRYYWIDRTTDTVDPNTISERLLKQCSHTPEIIDRNCIAIQYVRSYDQNRINHERCIVEANECSTALAMPVCVDQHLEAKPTVVPPISDENPSQVSANISIDHSCGDISDEYHFMDDYCYKILFHEVSWNDAKTECQRDNAMVFVPEKSITLQFIKSLFLRRRSYTSSGYAHVGVYYDNSSRTVIQLNTSNANSVLTVPDSNAVYDLCEKTFLERYTALMTSTSLTINEKNQLKKQQIGCAYIHLVSNTVPTIRCDEIPCNRTATVICQKRPTTQTAVVKAKREYVELPRKTSPSSTTPSSDDQSSSSIVSADIQSQIDSQDNIKSVGRDYAPIFFILSILFLLLLLGFITTIHNRRVFKLNGSIFRQSHQRNTNSIYTQLTSANEFDLN